MVFRWSISGVDLYLEPAPAGVGRRAWLEDALRTAVREGRLVSGTRLPPTRALAAELGIARGTVTAAYDQLAAEGYLIARHGAGTEVAELRTGIRTGEPVTGSVVGWSYDTPPIGWSSDPVRVRHNLAPGRPDVAAFPVDAWVRATRRVLPRVQTEVFANTDPRGLGEFRQVLADYLGRVRGVRAAPEAIVVTSGVMQSVALLADVLYRSGVRRIAMEEPSLPFHQEAIRRRGHEVVPMTVDAYGARCELTGEQGTAGGVGAAALTPAHQAGFGVALAPERRRAFVEWAQSSGGLIVEDDYDGEFRYDRQPVGAMQGMAPEHVAYLGTVSKTLAPGLRIGWMVLPPQLVLPVAEAKFYTDMQNEVIGQLVLADLIRGREYDRHVRLQRQRYRRRRDALLSRLRREVPEVRVRGAAAGVQLFLELPAAGPSEQQVLAQARKRGVQVVAAGDAWQQPDRPPMKAIGVGYGTPPEHAYGAALDALVESLRAAFDA